MLFPLPNCLRFPYFLSSDSHRISSPLKGPSELRSQVYVPAPPNTEPMPSSLIGNPMFGVSVATTATSTTGGLSSPTGSIPLSPRRSLTAAMRSAAAAAATNANESHQQGETPRRKKRRKFYHSGNAPWYSRRR